MGTVTFLFLLTGVIYFSLSSVFMVLGGGRGR